MRKPHQLPGWTKNSFYYSAPVGDLTHDLPPPELHRGQGVPRPYPLGRGGGSVPHKGVPFVFTLTNAHLRPRVLLSVLYLKTRHYPNLQTRARYLKDAVQMIKLCS